MKPKTAVFCCWLVVISFKEECYLTSACAIGSKFREEFLERFIR